MNAISPGSPYLVRQGASAHKAAVDTTVFTDAIHATDETLAAVRDDGTASTVHMRITSLIRVEDPMDNSVSVSDDGSGVLTNYLVPAGNPDPADLARYGKGHLDCRLERSPDGQAHAVISDRGEDGSLATIAVPLGNASHSDEAFFGQSLGSQICGVSVNHKVLGSDAWFTVMQPDHWQDYKLVDGVLYNRSANPERFP